MTPTWDPDAPERDREKRADSAKPMENATPGFVPPPLGLVSAYDKPVSEIIRDMDRPKEDQPQPCREDRECDHDCG